MTDPYHDEDVDDNALSVPNDMFHQNNDPPLIQAFKHMGDTFRNGGFCAERRKIERKQVKTEALQESVEVEETDGSETVPFEKEVAFDDLGKRVF